MSNCAVSFAEIVVLFFVGGWVGVGSVFLANRVMTGDWFTFPWRRP